MTLKSLLSLLLLLAVACAAVAAKDPQVSDDALTDMVRRKLANDPVVKGGALQVDVKNGTVLLRGQVELEKQKERAAKVAKKVKGVRGVDNQIAVKGAAR